MEFFFWIFFFFLKWNWILHHCCYHLSSVGYWEQTKLKRVIFLYFPFGYLNLFPFNVISQLSLHSIQDSNSRPLSCNSSPLTTWPCYKNKIFSIKKKITQILTWMLIWLHLGDGRNDKEPIQGEEPWSSG